MIAVAANISYLVHRKKPDWLVLKKTVLLHFFAGVAVIAKEILFDVTIRNANPTNKDQRINDGGGL